MASVQKDTVSKNVSAPNNISMISVLPKSVFLSSYHCGIPIQVDPPARSRPTANRAEQKKLDGHGMCVPLVCMGESSDILYFLFKCFGLALMPRRRQLMQAVPKMLNRLLTLLQNRGVLILCLCSRPRSLTRRKLPEATLRESERSTIMLQRLGILTPKRNRHRAQHSSLYLYFQGPMTKTLRRITILGSKIGPIKRAQTLYKILFKIRIELRTRTTISRHISPISNSLHKMCSTSNPVHRIFGEVRLNIMSLKSNI